MIFSTLINQYLAQDPEVAEKLSEYHHKIVEIKFLPFMRKKIFMTIHSDHISLSGQSEKSADVTISGTPLALLKAWQSKNSLIPENIEITGDILLLQNLKNIFNTIDIDWTEQLSKITGDSIAYAASQLFHKLNLCRKTTTNNLSRDLREYLQEEYHILVSRAELTDFYTSVDNLRDDVERLQTKLELIS